MHMTPPPFARFEWMIAWRYLRAKRVEGGVSVMTWISLIGIILAVFALIATLAVRAGFRALPISNRAVKRTSANDSMLLACESRSLPSYLYRLPSCGRLNPLYENSGGF